MNPRIVFPFSLALFFSSTAAFSATPAALDKEYDQVRAIALRDPKVRAAYQKADERLADKIVEIDPALKGYVKGRGTPTHSAAAKPVAEKKPFIKPAKPAKPAVPKAPAGVGHVIATGDTLSTIAAHYKVTVVALKQANPAVDEKKLQVGQKLAIPSAR